MKALFILTALVFALRATAQTYTVDSIAIQGGGGNSHGGSFSIAGRAGQAPEITLKGGTLTVDNSSWAAVTVVQVPGSPIISIRLADASHVLLSWPAAATGFALEQTDAVESGNWTAVSGSPVSAGGEWQMTLPMVAGHKFFRLRHQ